MRKTVLAAVYVNGKKARTLWCEPFACDISQYVVAGIPGPVCMEAVQR